MFRVLPEISLNYDENTCDPQSSSFQTVLRFQIWLKEMFGNSICLGLTESLDESSAVLIGAVFVTRELVDSPKVFWKKSFGVLK